MQYPETHYEKRKRLESTLRNEKRWFKLGCTILVILASLVFPLFLSWLFSKLH